MSSFPFIEQANKKGYWNNELESLGILPKEIIPEKNINSTAELDNIEELTNLVENIKQTMYQEYKTAYSERMTQLEEGEEECVVVV
jgi:hypothetical protein